MLPDVGIGHSNSTCAGPGLVGGMVVVVACCCCIMLQLALMLTFALCTSTGGVFLPSTGANTPLTHEMVSTYCNLCCWWWLHVVVVCVYMWWCQ